MMEFAHLDPSIDGLDVLKLKINQLSLFLLQIFGLCLTT
jgi:hypothetical protein